MKDVVTCNREIFKSPESRYQSGLQDFFRKNAVKDGKIKFLLSRFQKMRFPASVLRLFDQSFARYFDWSSAGINNASIAC